MRRRLAALPSWLALALALLLHAAPALAQASIEDRLREAVKKLTADLRATQDAQAGLKAQIDDLTKQRDAVQAQLDQAKAQLAQPAAAPADTAALAKLQADLAAARQDNAALRTALAKWQAAYKEAATLAQARDADAKRLDATLKTTTQTLGACKQANGKLIVTARGILHLYETQDFRSLLLKSYEPLLGIKRTELENLVQDYDDRILDAKLPAGVRSAP
jgi:chromosome segregation ATPase